MNKLVASIIILSCVFLIFFVRGFIFTDPDFGWHIRMGEIISQTGIPASDPFSYTMSSFPFVDHEWLTNIVLYTARLFVGDWALSLFLSLLSVGALLFALKRVNVKLDTKGLSALLLLSAAVLLQFFGIRPQVQSWLLLAVLLYIILDQKIFKKYCYYLPLIFLYWVNAHGSFGAGIAILSLVVFLRAFRLRKISVLEIGTLIVCFLTTFVNPYHQHVWTELWMQISDPHLRSRIQEWRPSIFSFNLPFIILIVLSAIGVIKYRKKYAIEELGVYLALLFQAISSVRHIPLWVVVALPIIAKSFLWFKQDVAKVKFGLARFNKSMAVFLGMSLVIFIAISALNIYSLKDYYSNRVYPTEAVVFLKSNQLEGNIFSPYGWGGYLIWKYPEKKVFIDGRMPSWRWTANLPNETNNAMNDYMDILSGHLHFKNQFEKYNIDTVLWSKSNGNYEGVLEGAIINFVAKLTGTKNNNYRFDLLEDLEKNNWEKVYEDEISVVYREPVVH